jgi:two-component system phosphate regulon sensor histidine kinase PhoR
MRFSLFWRFLAILLIPFLQILVITDFISLPLFQPFVKENTFLFLIIGFLASAYIMLKISRKYKIAIGRLNDILQKPETELSSTKLLKKTPPEIEKLSKTIKETISHNKEVQASLDADRKLFNSILGNMNDGILIADQNGIISLTNNTANQIFHIGDESAANHSLAEVIRDHRINELFENCSKSKQQEMVSFETAPEKTFIQCIATPLDPEIPGSILFLFQDLTRIRQLEIIRRDFVSNVSHELRTPLTSLKLITETLHDGAIDDPAISKNFIEKMDSEVDNLTQLVEELLELSKIESGRVPLEKNLIKPEDFINAACERMALQAQRAGLQLKNSTKKELPKTLVDSTRIEQVLVNLIHNAIKFTPPGGQVEVDAYQESEFIVYSVKDTGKGIPPKDLERIFERFYKTDRSRSERGTGLGLSISRHLVEAHNGRIWVESQPGQGSTFFFRIPIR